MEKAIKVTASIGVVMALLAGVCLWYLYLWYRTPPLRLRMSGDKVVVDVQTLGEYPTTVLRAEVRERQSGRIVWEIRRESRVCQIRGLVLRIGANPVRLTHPDYGNYAVVAPAGGKEFQLSSGIDYVVEVTGCKDWARAQAVFRFPQPLVHPDNQ